MKKLILFFSMLMLSSAFVCSQPSTGKITIEKRKYYQNGQALTPAQLKSLLAGNPASAPDYLKYKRNMSFASPMIIGGSVCVLAGAAISLAGSIKESNDLNNGTYSGDYPSGLGLILLGAVVDLAALPLILPANKQFTRSVELYNESQSKAYYRTIKLDMTVSSRGVGVRMNF
jgi:hypothetical protein